jgi:integrase
MAGLTALGVKNAKPGRHADGRGLYLVVRETGSRSWVARVQVGGQRQDFGLGSADAVSLSDARSAAAELRRKLMNGEEPERKKRRKPREIPSFREAAIECHEAMKDGWRNKRHTDSWLSSLENHAYKHFGSKPVNAIDSVMVRNALAPIWLKTPETARRVLQRIGSVLDFAHIQGWCPHEAALRSVRKGLPRQPRRDNHYAAMPYGDVPAFVQALAELPSSAGRDALRFTILTAVRSGETRHAVWPEFDLKKAIWTIPADRMKAHKEHVVPLSPAAVELLKRRWKYRASDEGLVFSNDGNRPLSDMTMTKVLRDMGYEDTTVHGFRSAFTDWAAEETNFPKEVVDKALAHQLPDRVEAAYRRTDFFAKRRELMLSWAQSLTSTAPIRRRRGKAARAA